jgi:Rab3 GTPase-activating protein catalytic subunit
MWVESWENAPPIPAYKQKRLFDDTKEAEKVLHFLSNLKPFELVLMLLPCLFHSAILSLRKKLADTVSLPSASGYLQDAISIASTVQRVTLDSLPIYQVSNADRGGMLLLSLTVCCIQECIGLIEKAEHDISTACSLQLKLKQGLEFMGKAGKGSDVELKELMISVQMLLEGPELVLQDPMTSVTGLSFKGLLSAQLALQVMSPLQLITIVSC